MFMSLRCVAIHQQPEFLPFSEHVNKINAHVELSREKNDNHDIMMNWRSFDGISRSIPTDAGVVVRVKKFILFNSSLMTCRNEHIVDFSSNLTRHIWLKQMNLIWVSKLSPARCSFSHSCAQQIVELIHLQGENELDRKRIQHFPLDHKALLFT